MSPAATARPKKSRLGLLVILAVMGWLAWYFAFSGPGLPPPPTVDELYIRPLPHVVWGMKPDWTRSAGRYRGPATSNSHGFRGPEISEPKPEGRTRVVCLGGSTTYGYAVDDDATYPVRLQQALAAARPGLDVEVINAGLESYTLLESLANLKHYVLPLQPDVVVVYHGANDVRPRRYANFVDDYSHYRIQWDGTLDGWAPVPGTEVSGINAFLQKHRPDDNGDVAENLRRSGTGAYRRMLTEFVAAAQAAGVQVVLVTLGVQEAAARAEQQPELVTGIREHNDVTRAVAAATGAQLIDLAADLERDPSWFVDSVHVDARGCQEKARLIAAELAGQL